MSYDAAAFIYVEPVSVLRGAQFRLCAQKYLRDFQFEKLARTQCALELNQIGGS